MIFERLFLSIQRQHSQSYRVEKYASFFDMDGDLIHPSKETFHSKKRYETQSQWNLLETSIFTLLVEVKKIARRN
jgi:hypothetical protein